MGFSGFCAAYYMVEASQKSAMQKPKYCLPNLRLPGGSDGFQLNGQQFIMQSYNSNAFVTQVHPTGVREGRGRARVQLRLRAHVPGAGQERGPLLRRPQQEGFLPKAPHHALPEGLFTIIFVVYKTVNFDSCVVYDFIYYLQNWSLPVFAIFLKFQSDHALRAKLLLN